MNVGLLVHHFYSHYTQLITERIREECGRLGYRLIIFEGREVGSTDSLLKFYNSVYQLVGPERLDGLIIAAATVVQAEGLDAAERYAEQLCIPVICIGRQVGKFPVVRTDNASGIRAMFEHLTGHGKKHIAFVTGHLSQADGFARKEEYIRLLRANGIPFDPCLIFEGDFSSLSGQHAAEAMENRIRDGRIDAVIFSNDEMAFGALTRFRKSGIRCPEDIPITGFDDSAWSHLTDPPLTTVSQNHNQLADYVMNLLVRMIHGEVVPEDSQLPVTPVIRCSCGCSEYSVTVRGKGLSEIPEENLLLTESLQSYNLELLFGMLEKILTTKEINDFAIVRFPHPLTYRNLPQFTPPENSRIVFCLAGGIRVHHEDPFKTMSILPSPVLERMKTITLIVKPLFFGNEIFGYLIAACSKETDQMVDDIRLHLSSLIKGSLLLDERIVMEHRLKEALEELRSANRRLNDLSSCDELTGLFNRRGFLQEATLHLESGLGGDHLIAYIDMDNLKTINDRYGHEEGDTAIRMVASVLSDSVRERDIVCRLGGDEFLLLVKEATPSLMQVMEDRFEQNLRRVMDLHRKPYEVSFSWGFLLAKPGDRLEETIRQADERMLVRKREKKKVKESGR